MTAERIRYPEWRKEFAATRYPFADSATLKNAQGIFLPEEMFLDACLHPIGSSSPLWLTQITITHQNVTFFIGDIDQIQRAYATTTYTNAAAVLNFVDNFNRAAGVIVCDPFVLATLQTWPPGNHLFAIEQTEFAATCCIPAREPGLRGLVTEDGELFTGDVWLVGGDGVVLTTDHVIEHRPAVLGGPRQIALLRVDIVGDPLSKRKICGPEATAKTYLQRLVIQSGCYNIVSFPDENGDFKLTVGQHDPDGVSQTVLRIRNEGNKLRIFTVGETLHDVR